MPRITKIQIEILPIGETVKKVEGEPGIVELISGGERLEAIVSTGNGRVGIIHSKYSQPSTPPSRATKYEVADFLREVAKRIEQELW